MRHRLPSLPRLLHEIARFGVVGAASTVVDIGVFNALRVSALSGAPLGAKAVSMAVAATTSYVANREWTWRHRTRRGVHREYPIYIVLSVIGFVIAEGCLAISHYVIGARGVLADNISANGFGLVFGSAWRFWSFRRWVFPARLPEGPPVPEPVSS